MGDLPCSESERGERRGEGARLGPVLWGKREVYGGAVGGGACMCTWGREGCEGTPLRSRALNWLERTFARSAMRSAWTAADMESPFPSASAHVLLAVDG